DLATFSAVGSLYDKMLAVYYPWVKVVDATDATQTVDIPPSCVVAGVYARTDGERGVHKAPAGISGGICRSVVGVTNPASEIEHDKFVERSTNKEGIKVNFIRPVVGVGTCIWGARTWYPSGAASGERYVNVCRLEAFLKDSLRDGLMWVTFKPNTPELWGQVNRSVTAFMRRLWQEGALFGSKEEEAFQVIVDKTNNAETMALGELHITLKYAPVKPAEFVVLTFTQKTSQG
ncbi:MAG: phage tail sheath family protein, partial [Bdellovibrionales bacterium]